MIMNRRAKDRRDRRTRTRVRRRQEHPSRRRATLGKRELLQELKDKPGEVCC